RRLSVFLKGIKLESEIYDEEVKGPAENIIFTKNKLTKAGEGFLKSKNISENNIVRKDGFVFYSKKSGGEEVERTFQELFIKCINSISFDKTMKWEKSGFLFPRPIRWIIGFVNNNPMNFSLGPVKNDTFTFGNRNVSNSKIPIFNGYDYFEKMNENYVEIDFEKRKAMMLSEIKKAAENLSLTLIEDEDLLNEVTDLVEYPVIFYGNFDKRFLNLPKEIIIAALKQHQKYFSLKKEDGSLSSYFVFVSNAPYADTEDIINNNQRIIESRLEDAEFYYKNDLSHNIKYYENILKKTVFHDKLGSFYEKTQRNKKLASFVLKQLDMEEDNLDLISMISKFDIATEMIKDGKEFTKLQGVIGTHYAKAMGYKDEIANISREHYLPLTNEGELPESRVGIAFSIADKTDNICGAYLSGNKPTGNKDAMSVRRDSLSLIYLLTQKKLKININEILEESLKEYGRIELKQEISDYMKKRIEVLFTSYKIPYDVVRCALYSEKLIPIDILKKSILVKEMKTNEDFRDIVGGLKRVTNILKNEKESENKRHFENKFEFRLYESGMNADRMNETLLKNSDYEAVLINLLSIRKPIDELFDNVMVLDDDIEVKERRVQLLFFIRNIFLKFGDFSQIVFESPINAEEKK
ncbi:MAG: glycine--tRNA ligase subunit beta, partial [bacterium (Candidatus Stahlbacteria) CG23_combo_of_CG06-09_8_20_14_all_34_7]